MESLLTKYKNIFIALLAGVITSAILLVLFLNGYMLPSWIKWKNCDYTMQDDAENEIRIILDNKKIEVAKNGNNIWKSKDKIKFSDVLCCDIDSDKNLELVTLCWKKGKFGKHHPFWQENDSNWSQHIFVYEINTDTVKEKWMASDLMMHVADMRLDDDKIIIKDISNNISIWKWISWGLKSVDLNVRLMAVGDNLIHEPIYKRSLNGNDDYDDLYENIGDYIKTFDIAVVNQETPLVYSKDMYSDYPDFGTPVYVGKALKKNGFNVFTCANNHEADKDIAGIEDTIKFCDENDIICLGIKSSNDAEKKRYKVVEKNGIKIAMLNYTYGTNMHNINEKYPGVVNMLDDEERIYDDLESATKNSDIVVVFVHWGKEYSQIITDEQKYWADIFAKGGADIVVGSHPHVLQSYEKIVNLDGHSTHIFYSLGNFMSAQTKPECVVGGLANIEIGYSFNGVEVKKCQIEPVVTHQSSGTYTVYKLEDYPAWMAKTHRLNLTKNELYQRFDENLAKKPIEYGFELKLKD